MGGGGGVYEGGPATVPGISKPVVQNQARSKSVDFWREDTGMHAAPYQICAHSLLLPDGRKFSNITGKRVDSFSIFLLNRHLE
jgi:hypothetical protein